ncbi:pro-FMRFamide-related neuropeptide VF [Anguilla rostrata]|uniref:pro-FMRFamide-related neuropeptide VF n=1 Tax=Anguilla rostrata TaxID=7938 RepID=UPI0030CA7741
MNRFAASLLLAAGIIGRFAPRTVTCAGGHGSAATFAQRVGRLPVYPEAMQESERARSLEMDDFKVQEVPDDTMGSTPIILKLYPPVAKPALLHANLPLRFGRSSPRAAARMLQFPLSLTRRFGRSPETDSPIALPCHQCARMGGVASPSATLPQRFGRTNRFDSRPARTLAKFARGIAAQLQRRSQARGLSFVNDVREEDILNIPKDIEASSSPASD